MAVPVLQCGVSSAAYWQQGAASHHHHHHTTTFYHQNKGTALNENRSYRNNGDYQTRPHELISSSHCLYEVLERLGCGTFGQVVKCWKKDTQEVVALKILKSIPSYAKQGQVEIDILTRLSKISSEEFNFVRAYESFTHQGHICIVFELLQINLYDYLKKNKFQPLHLKHIRPVAQQVSRCLDKLMELGLVHADIKPENIMLVDPERQPFRVKVIDFGSATTKSQSNTTTYLQSRYYRAPEVILGFPYSEAIDMWSLGCVLAELYLGWPLFPGASEFHQIKYICQMLGSPPSFLMGNVTKARRFFKMDTATQQWRLKPPSQLQLEAGVDTVKETRRFIFTSIDSIASALSNHGNQSIEEHLDTMQFVMLLRSLLTLDPHQRASASQILQHPFITMQHLAAHTNTHSVRDWIQCMQVCRHSRTTHSYSPLSHPHTFTPPPFILPPPHTSTLSFYSSPSTLAYYPTLHSSSEITSSQLGNVPTWPHPPPGYQSGWALDGTNSVAVDTGYVSGDPSPATFTQLDPEPSHMASAGPLPLYHHHYPLVSQTAAPIPPPSFMLSPDFQWMTSSLLNYSTRDYKR